MWMGLLPAKWKASALLALHFYTYMLQKATFTWSESAYIWRRGGKLTQRSFVFLIEAAAWTIPMKGAQMTPWKYLHQLKYLILRITWQVKWAIPHFSFLNFLMKYLALQCSCDCFFWTSNVSLKPLSLYVLSLSLRLCFPYCEHFSGFLAFPFT